LAHPAAPARGSPPWPLLPSAALSPCFPALSSHVRALPLRLHHLHAFVRAALSRVPRVINGR
jgi:hypothetical protein